MSKLPSEQYILQAAERTIHGRRVSMLRRQGFIPAVLYGHGVDNTLLSLPAHAFSQLYERAGESSLVDLVIANRNPVKVLIHDLQRDPLTDAIAHVDFHQVRMDEKIRAEVEIVFEGVAPAEKELGGILVKSLSHLEVECLPTELPHNFIVDLSTLKTLDDAVHVEDLHLPENLHVQIDPHATIVSIEKPRSEEELAALNETVVEDVGSVEAATEKVKTAEEEEPSVSGDNEKNETK